MIKPWMLKPIAAVPVYIGSNYFIPDTDIPNGGATCIDKTGPANANGTITSFKIYTSSGITGCKMGTFYGSGTSWTNRAGSTIGTVSSGTQTFTGLNCSVQTNDIIGIYYTYSAYSYINVSSAGGSGYGYANGDKFGAGSATYGMAPNYRISMYGTG